MFSCKSSGFTLFATVFLVTAPSVAAQPQTFAAEWNGGGAIDLGGLPGATSSAATGVNSAGQVVGYSVVGGVDYATEWSGGKIINLGAGVANAINNAGQVVGASGGYAVEWSGGGVINLGSMVGQPGAATGINNAGQVVGYVSIMGSPPYPIAIEWNGGSSYSILGGDSPAAATAINNAGQVVGYSVVFQYSAPYSAAYAGSIYYPAELKGGGISMGQLPGATSSFAFGVNNAGQAVGEGIVAGVDYATEWSGGSVINLGAGVANAINDAGQAVGSSNGAATEWSGGGVISLGLGGASAINDAGLVVGYSVFGGPVGVPDGVPEPSTWAMMLLGFAGLGVAGARRTKRSGAAATAV